MNGTIQWSDLVVLCGLAGGILAGFWRLSSWNSALNRRIADIELTVEKNRTEAAEKFVSARYMQEFEERLVGAIGRLGDRLDRIFDKTATK